MVIDRPESFTGNAARPSLRDFHSTFHHLQLKPNLPIMPPDPLIDEEGDYASSEDSDFAPDTAVDQASEHSESEDGDEPTIKKQGKPNSNEEDGYDNSGDEAIIEKGKKRRKRAKAKGEDVEDEGGEGGLVKTRRQRALE